MIEHIEIQRVEAYEGRPYEWATGRIDYAVDPAGAGEQRIADLVLAPRDSDGKVRFTGDIVIVRPTDGGNGRALVSVANRGMVALPYSGAVLPVGATSPASAGDGYLLDRGWTIVIPGWQWDVPAGLAGLKAPVASVEPGWLRADLRIDAAVQERSLADSFPGIGGMPPFAFTAYPTFDLDDPDAVLRVRVAQMGPSEVVPREQWRFTSPTTIALEGGFPPLRWYELVYRSEFAPVAGAGLLAFRDVGVWLHEEHEFTFIHGVSQSGRLLREFLAQGLNVDEHGVRAFDGVFAEIASARRGEFNRRYAQPGLLSPMMPEYGAPHDTTSLLTRQRELGGVPKLMLANSSWEYWRGDGALVHQDAVTGDDLDEDPDARVHLISGADHIAGAIPFKRMMPLANPPHGLDSGPIIRALFQQLQDWVIDDTEPEPSQVPRKADGTAVTRDEVLARIVDAETPDQGVLPFTPEIDPAVVEWPVPQGPARVALVSAIDENGNEVAGIRLPAVETGIAAYTGWNPRRHVDGLPDVLYDLVGSRLASPARPTLDQVRDAARRLVDRRFLLPEDMDSAVSAALAEMPA